MENIIEKIKKEIDLSEYVIYCEQYPDGIQLDNEKFIWGVGHVWTLDNKRIDTVFIYTEYCWYEQISSQLNEFKKRVLDNYGYVVITYDEDFSSLLFFQEKPKTDGNLPDAIKCKLIHEFKKLSANVNYILYNKQHNTLCVLSSDLQDRYKCKRKQKAIESYIRLWLWKKYEMYFEMHSTYSNYK